MEQPRVLTAERSDAPRRKRPLSPWLAACLKVLGKVWHELMRLRLAVWLLIVMAAVMVVGSIFPQGYGAETYIQSWGEGRYQALSRLGLLNLFHTKFFLFLGIILLLNLLVCSIARLSGRRGVGVSESKPPESARIVGIGGDPNSAVSKAVRALTERGYFVSRVTGGVITARRGPWPEGVSLLYHLAMALAILGFIVTALHSFEGDVTLYPGERVAVRTMSSETGWQKYRGRIAAFNIIAWHPFRAATPDTSRWRGREVRLTLNEFITEWELYEDKYYPKDWISDVSVEVVGHGPRALWPSRMVEVNRPLRAGGLTFYQMAYEQEFDVVVQSEGEEVERVRANSYVPFALESIEGMFFPGTLRVGTLYKKYEPAERIVPHVTLSWQPPAGTPTPEPDVPEVEGESSAEDLSPAAMDTVGGALAEGEEAAAETVAVVSEEPPEPERIDLGTLSAEEPLEHEGYMLMLEDPYEGSVLSYRHDPGVPLLYVAITAFLLGLAIRTYWPSYRVNIWIQKSAHGAVGRLAFRATGMLGEPDDVADELVKALGRELKRPPKPTAPTGGGGAPAKAEPSPGGNAPEGALAEAEPGSGGDAPTASQDSTADSGARPAPPTDEPAGEPWKPGEQPLRDALPSDDEEPKPGPEESPGSP
jgi:cytochrome c biogenesis protein ResB